MLSKQLFAAAAELQRLHKLISLIDLASARFKPLCCGSLPGPKFPQPQVVNRSDNLSMHGHAHLRKTVDGAQTDALNQHSFLCTIAHCA
jgi:hypothetical protein